jgi:hypothetical protein
MATIKVERTSTDKLTKEEWGFSLNDTTMRLHFRTYMRSTRPSTKHKFRDEEGCTGTNTSGVRLLKIEACPMPADVSEEARQTLVAKITVGR